jgi:hypothetical protein
VFTPSIVPAEPDIVYIVEDDYGPIGRSYRETDITRADRESALGDLYRGEFKDPVRAVAFNTREGWSRDVSYEFAVEVQRRADLDRRELGGTLREFVEHYTRPARQLALRLA